MMPFQKKIAEEIEGKMRIYLRSQKRRFADGRWELIGLELALGLLAM
jgi:hypothetical protein